MATDQTPREFTGEEALYYAAGSDAIRTGDVRGLAQLISEHPELLYVYAPRNLREIGGRPLFRHLANWPGRWPRRLESAALLIAAGADIDYRGGDEYGETVLTEAVSCYDFSLTELLVEAGASPDGVGDDRRPMAEALFYNSPIAAKVLVDHGATIDLEGAVADRRKRATGPGARLRRDQRAGRDRRLPGRSRRGCQRKTVRIPAPDRHRGLGRGQRRIRAVPDSARRPPGLA